MMLWLYSSSYYYNILYQQLGSFERIPNFKFCELKAYIVLTSGHASSLIYIYIWLYLRLLQVTGTAVLKLKISGRSNLLLISEFLWPALLLLVARNKVNLVQKTFIYFLGLIETTSQVLHWVTNTSSKHSLRYTQTEEIPLVILHKICVCNLFSIRMNSDVVSLTWWK